MIELITFNQMLTKIIAGELTEINYNRLIFEDRISPYGFSAEQMQQLCIVIDNNPIKENANANLIHLILYKYKDFQKDNFHYVVDNTNYFDKITKQHMNYKSYNNSVLEFDNYLTRLIQINFNKVKVQRLKDKNIFLSFLKLSFELAVGGLYNLLSRVGIFKALKSYKKEKNPSIKDKHSPGFILREINKDILKFAALVIISSLLFFTYQINFFVTIAVTVLCLPFYPLLSKFREERNEQKILKIEEDIQKNTKLLTAGYAKNLKIEDNFENVTKTFENLLLDNKNNIDYSEKIIERAIIYFSDIPSTHSDYESAIKHKENFLVLLSKCLRERYDYFTSSISTLVFENSENSGKTINAAIKYFSDIPANHPAYQEALYCCGELLYNNTQNLYRAKKYLQLAYEAGHSHALLMLNLVDQKIEQEKNEKLTGDKSSLINQIDPSAARKECADHLANKKQELSFFRKHLSGPEQKVNKNQLAIIDILAKKALCSEDHQASQQLLTLKEELKDNKAETTPAETLARVGLLAKKIMPEFSSPLINQETANNNLSLT